MKNSLKVISSKMAQHATRQKDSMAMIQSFFEDWEIFRDQEEKENFRRHTQTLSLIIFIGYYVFRLI